MARSGNGILLSLALIALVSCGGGGSGPENEVSVSIESAGGGDSSLGEMLLGGVQRLDFSTSKTRLDFSKSAPTNNFVLTLTALAPSPEEATLQLRQSRSPSESAAPITQLNLRPDDADEEPASLHHQYLREWERMMPESGQFQKVRHSSLAAVTTPTREGDLQTFRVLSTLGSITTYQEVTAKLRVTTDNLLIYVDQQNEDHLTNRQIESLAKNFDGIALPRERDLFGQESDINEDRHISILMTCVVNRMSGSGGIVTGFFFPGDLYQRSDSNPASNAQEIFYTLVPDPDGVCGMSISSEFVITNILPGVLAHEYQHMASFNQHLLTRNGATEEPWLNEALSHFAEDITGFGNENPSRVKLYLLQPSRTPIISSSSPTLTERGGGYLFIRYLYEQQSNGDDFIRRLLKTDKTGIANLEAAYGDNARFGDLLGRWGVALALSETGATSNPQYNYRPRISHPSTRNFTGICIRCSTQDGRGTVLGGPVMTSLGQHPSSSTVKSTAVQFYRLKNASGTLEIEGKGSDTLSGSLIRLEKN